MKHDHNISGHCHGSGNERAAGIAAFLTGIFMLAEVFGGIISGSLALLADAVHMSSDFASLLLTWLAFRLARKPADWRRTYGFDRFSVLAAFINGLALFVVVGWICFEAYERFQQPVVIVGSMMMWIAIGGLAVNILVFWILARADSNNLNLQAAMLHVAGDLLGSVAALIASLVIVLTGWTPIDPILSVFVSLLVLRSAWYILQESGNTLLEGAPQGFNRDEVVRTIVETVPAVVDVQHVHAWSITQEKPMATLEVLVEKDADTFAVKGAVKKILHTKFGIGHTTVEIDKAMNQNSTN